MATPVQDQGEQKYWINGIPIANAGRYINDQGTQRFWEDGKPDGEMAWPSSRVTTIFESLISEGVIN